MAIGMRDFALEVHFSQWEFKARYNMAGSDAESLKLNELLAMASGQDRQAFDQISLGYTETFGALALREEIARTYDTVTPNDILCFAGAEEAIYIAMRVLLTPEDHAIIITPNYQAAETIPLSICAATGVALDPDNNWALDLDLVRAALRPNTRLVSINFPNNPTGCLIPRATFDGLIDLCRERGIWLFSDEVYRLMEHRPEARLPAVVDAYEKGLSLNVISKAYGLPGLRIGWLACKDKDILIRCERYKHFLSICNAAPSETLATIALRASDKILMRIAGILRANLAELDTFFAEFPELFEWRHPDGACIAFIRYKGKDGVQTFTKRLVDEAGVLLLPASVYRSDLSEVPADRFRIGFGRLHVPEGLAAMRSWLRRNTQ